MNKYPELPEETEFARLLGHIQPRPSAQFYQQMASAPWMDRSKRIWAFNRVAWRALAAIVVVVAIVIGGALAFPGLQATAQQIARFFKPAATDAMVIQLTTPFTYQDLSDPGHSFPLNYEQAQTLVDFRLWQTSWLPEGMIFKGARYDPTLKAITFLYGNSKGSILFTQRRAGNIQEYFSIGANAPVETLQVRNVQGEYVLGGWRISPGSESKLETPTPGTQVSLGIYWDPNLPQINLRWQEKGLMFVLQGNGTELSKDELIRAAENISER